MIDTLSKLKKYIKHDQSCTESVSPFCTCGLDDILNKNIEQNDCIILIINKMKNTIDFIINECDWENDKRIHTVLKSLDVEINELMTDSQFSSQEITNLQNSYKDLLIKYNKLRESAIPIVEA